MLVTFSTMVAGKLGFKTARIAQAIYMNQPHYNIAKLNLSRLAKESGVSLSTVQRIIKVLINKGYMVKHKASMYSFTIKFFEDFPDYICYEIE